MKNSIRAAKSGIVGVLGIVLVGVPGSSLADQTDLSLAQQYLGCMAAVDDAGPVFLADLQSTCLGRVGTICEGKDGDVPMSQIVECIHAVAGGGAAFLQEATLALPEEVEKKGFFGHGYERRRDSILASIEAIDTAPRPEDFASSLEQVVSMAASVSTLFWLAREKETTLNAYVEAFMNGP
jgi:hypothetical protein